ncbi:MAG: protein jag [Oscillospiraceae bacterium]|nr:protein jag [Oscillospiraceae bacterium]
MRKWIETTGRSEEDAIAAALIQLDLERDDVSVEVLERAKSGFLGFGSNPARVRVSYEVEGEDETPAPIKKEARPEPKAQEKKAENKQQAQLQQDDEIIIAKEEPAAAPAPADDARAEHIREFLTGLLAQMQVDAVPEISVSSEGGYKVVLQGQGLGAIIGRRGETLDAIQQLTNYAVNRSQSRRVRIHIDAEGYRAKREEALQHLARKVAGKVVKYRKNVTLEAMNAYERHVIHSALQDCPDVTTYSIGTEPNRRTVVAYAPGEHR